MTKFGDGNIWKWLVANVLGRTMPTTENAQDGDVPVYRDGEIGWEAQGSEECLPLAGGSMDEGAYILLNDNAGQDTAITGGTVNTHRATTTESGTDNYNTFINPTGVHTNAFIGNSETEQTKRKYSTLRPGNLHMEDSTFERAASLDILLREGYVAVTAPKGRVSLLGAAPEEDYDLVSKKYVDDAVAGAGGSVISENLLSANVTPESNAPTTVNVDLSQYKAIIYEVYYGGAGYSDNRTTCGICMVGHSSNIFTGEIIDYDTVNNMSTTPHFFTIKATATGVTINSFMYTNNAWARTSGNYHYHLHGIYGIK